MTENSKGRRVHYTSARSYGVTKCGVAGVILVTARRSAVTCQRCLARLAP